MNYLSFALGTLPIANRSLYPYGVIFRIILLQILAQLRTVLIFRCVTVRLGVMQIDVKSSIEGLWLAPTPYGYLGDWFGRFRHPLGQFVPLKPGLNVVYGRNGAGKTQLLRAIELASRFKMSSYEGFLLRNPRVGTQLIFDKSAEEIIKYYRDSESNETDFTDYLGLSIQLNTTEENQLRIHSIINEFLIQRRCMLARSMSPKWDDGSRGSATEMNDPESIQLVPVLLPQDEAPVTRAHARDIANSYSTFVESISAQMDAFETDEKRTHFSFQVAPDQFEKWVDDWMWSPLMNQRNFGFVETEGWAWAPETHAHALINCESSALFLPNIWSHTMVPGYEEFQERNSNNSNFHFSLTRESGRDSNDDPQPLFLSDEEMGIPNYRRVSASDKIVAEARELRAKYLGGLQGKLSFLPGLGRVHFETREADPTQGRLKASHLIKLSDGISASLGSDAERRWLALAREAQARTTDWVIIDEPEAGLHRTAEAELAQVLASPAWNSGSVIIVATHSPEFLDLANAHVLHVESGNIREFTSTEREELDALGLRAADLLTQIRSFLLVEGEHEKLIFEALFAHELRRLRCKIIVARGGKAMRDVFESQMIFEFTDAMVISLLDNIDAQAVTSLWKEAREIAGKGKLFEASHYVRSRLPGNKSGENRFLSEFLTLALSNGQHERVEVWGLSKGDILYYFSPSDFGLKFSFEDLVREHQEQLKPGGDNFKTWARKKYRADFSEVAVLAAAQSLDHIPSDFGDLLMRIAALTRSSNSDDPSE